MKKKKMCNVAGSEVKPAHPHHISMKSESSPENSGKNVFQKSTSESWRHLLLHFQLCPWNHTHHQLHRGCECLMVKLALHRQLNPMRTFSKAPKEFPSVSAYPPLSRLESCGKLFFYPKQAMAVVCQFAFSYVEMTNVMTYGAEAWVKLVQEMQ